MLPGNIGAEIGRVDQTISKLAQDLRFDGSILLRLRIRFKIPPKQNHRTKTKSS